MPDFPIKVDVMLNSKTFKSFAWFNSFVKTKRIRLMTGFIAIMTAFAVAVFILGKDTQGSGLLAGVLFFVGVIVPSAQILQFSLFLKQQCKQFSLENGSYVYTINFLNATDILIEKDDEKNSFKWSDTHKVHFSKDCAYIYLTPQKAFLLPYNQIEGGKETLTTLHK